MTFIITFWKGYYNEVLYNGCYGSICFGFISSQTVPEKPLRCEGGLGMENGEISDDQINASSKHDGNTPPKVARLNRQDQTENLQGAWVASGKDLNQWLQIDLKVPNTAVTGVATQGRNGNEHWVTKYKLQYSNDEVNFQYYREQGQTTNKVS